MSECSGKERRKNIGAAIKQLQRCVIIKKKKKDAFLYLMDTSGQS